MKKFISILLLILFFVGMISVVFGQGSKTTKSQPFQDPLRPIFDVASVKGMFVLNYGTPGQFKMPTTKGTAGYYLKSLGNGQTTWAAVTGSGGSECDTCDLSSTGDIGYNNFIFRSNKTSCINAASEDSTAIRAYSGNDNPAILGNGKSTGIEGLGRSNGVKGTSTTYDGGIGTWGISELTGSNNIGVAGTGQIGVRASGKDYGVYSTITATGGFACYSTVDLGFAGYFVSNTGIGSSSTYPTMYLEYTNASGVALEMKGKLKIKGTGTGSCTFKTTSNNTNEYTLPADYPGTTGYILSSTTAGALSWVSPLAGSTYTASGTAPLTLSITGTAISGNIAYFSSTSGGIVPSTGPANTNSFLSSDGSWRYPIDFGATMEFTGAGNGIILVSPNGTRYKLTVSNVGTIVISTP